MLQRGCHDLLRFAKFFFLTQPLFNFVFLGYSMRLPYCRDFISDHFQFSLPYFLPYLLHFAPPPKQQPNSQY